MPSFKPKTAKKININKKNSITLDGKHKEFLHEFANDEQDKIPELKQEKKKIKTAFNRRKSIESRKFTNNFGRTIGYKIQNK